MPKKIYTDEEAKQRKNARQKEYNKSTNYKSQNEYLKKRSKVINFRVFTPQDDDIVDFLDTLPNKAAYFKNLIREDIEKRKAAGEYTE